MPAVRTWGTKHGLPIAMGAMAALGTFLLGLGQSNLMLASVALFASATSVYFTDITGWFRLHRALANLVALIAVGYSLIDFFSGDRETQLLSVANLLVYLQIVLLYQEKNDRVYWQLIMLSLLQVVVASALSLGFQFGVLLVVYLFTALATMALFVVEREAERFKPAPAVPPKPARRAGTVKLRGRPQPLVETVSRPADRWSSWRLLRQVFGLGLWTLVATVVFFFSLPRTGDSVWLGPGASIIRQTGFSTHGVNLGENSRLRQDPTPVLRVSFRDGNGANYPVRGPVYLRGLALSNYQHGRWPAGRMEIWNDDLALPRAPSGVSLVTEEIILEPTTEGTLFTTFPAYKIDGTPGDIFLNPNGQHLFCGDEGPPFMLKPPPPQYHYVLGTSALRHNEQRTIVPHGYRLSERYADFTEYYNQLTALPAADSDTLVDSLAGLKATASQVIRDAGLQGANSLRKAQALEAYFKNSGLYTYSLDQLDVPHQAGVDPIEDFVTNHHTGHCEFFASALALMCRSQDIPARLAVGFAFGEYNSVGGYYTMRQSDAHAWVEVLLPANDVPADTFLPQEFTANGAWLRLDPTPPSTEDELDSLAIGPLARIGEFIDYAQTMWTEYVLGLNSERQEKAIYRPLRERIAEFAQTLFDRTAWQEFWRHSAESLGMHEGAEKGWFNWRAGLAVFVAALALVGMARLVWTGLQLLRELLGRHVRRRAERQGPTVPFYARLEALLAQHGLRRDAGQTQREFAAAVGRHLSATPASAPAADVPAVVAEAFYRTRFGSKPLDSGELSQLDSALLRLQLVLTSAAHAGNSA